MIHQVVPSQLQSLTIQNLKLLLIVVSDGISGKHTLGAAMFTRFCDTAAPLRTVLDRLQDVISQANVLLLLF